MRQSSLPASITCALVAASVLIFGHAALAQDCNCSHLDQPVACPPGVGPNGRSVEFVSGGTRWMTQDGRSVLISQSEFPPCAPPAPPAETPVPTPTAPDPTPPAPADPLPPPTPTHPQTPPPPTTPQHPDTPRAPATPDTPPSFGTPPRTRERTPPPLPPPGVPPISGPTPPYGPPAQPSHRDGIAMVATECFYPTGKLSVHLVDEDTHSTILFGNTRTFTSLDDIIAQLSGMVAPRYDPLAICGRCIQTLEIWGHGDTGGGYLSFGQEQAIIGDNTALLPDADAKLAALGALMCAGGSIVMNECNAGANDRGTMALQLMADRVGVPVSGATGKLKGCRVFGGLLTGYKQMQPGPNATTPRDRPPRAIDAGH